MEFSDEVLRWTRFLIGGRPVEAVRRVGPRPFGLHLKRRAAQSLRRQGPHREGHSRMLDHYYMPPPLTQSFSLDSFLHTVVVDVWVCWVLSSTTVVYYCCITQNSTNSERSIFRTKQMCSQKIFEELDHDKNGIISRQLRIKLSPLVKTWESYTYSYEYMHSMCRE